MGRDDASSDEGPAHVVYVSAFRIWACQVTVGEWQACVAAGGCEVPRWPDSSTRSPYYAVTEFRHYPVVAINWDQAAGFCQWAGGRLPTEAEWEKAARGGCEMRGPESCGPEDRPLYPWGDDPPDCARANFYEDRGVLCVGDTDRVGARSPLDESVYGAHDLAGNVWEWVRDYYGMFYYRHGGPPWVDPEGPSESSELRPARVLRGGMWGSLWDGITVTNRHIGGLEVGWQLLPGLRCVRPAGH